MALTQLADAIDNEIYLEHFLLRKKNCSALFDSGVVVEDESIRLQLEQQSGCDIILPYWNDLDDSKEAQISSDDPALACDPCKADMGQERAIKHTRTKQWSAASLVKACAAGDPLDVFTSQSAEWWARSTQRHLLAQLEGIAAHNMVVDNGDMTFDAVVNGVGGSTVFDGANFIQALATMGDCSNSLTAVVMHSVVYHNLLTNNIITFIPESETNRNIATYMGARVIVDDNLPVDGSGNYTSYIFGTGAFSYAPARHDNAIVIDRDECAGNGEGVETLYTRHHYVLHPRGFSFDRTANGGIAGNSPTNPEEANPDFWSRVFPRKNIPLAFLVTTG